ncbi:hypothetical protein AGDE_10319 [Angomonas deanei]|nr:hypothetical protein AGDE_10319 [Angomonas deanei]|eukprot:EPY28714.1 hypothetical protein AGDE_10319 [Angomonas deanei]
MQALVVNQQDEKEVKAQLYEVDRNQKPINENMRFALLTLGCFSIVCTSFGSYTFNLVATDILDRYHWGQRESTVISTCGMVVGYVVLPYSVLFDFFGPLPIAIISIFIFPLGSLLVALCFQGVIVASVVKLCVFYSFMNIGTSYYSLMCIQSLLYYFPTRRGETVALLVCMMGVGSSMTSSLYAAFFVDRSSFFYFLMVYAVIISVLNCIFMRFPKYHVGGFEARRITPEEKERREKMKGPYLSQEPPMVRFYYGLGLVITVIIYTTVTSAVINAKKIKEPHRLVPFASVTVVLWAAFSLILVPFEKAPAFFRKVLRRQVGSDRHEGSSEEPVYAEPAYEDPTKKEVQEVTLAQPLDGLSGGDFVMEELATVKHTETEVDFIAPQYQTSFWRNLLGPNLWCLLWTLFVVKGTELMIMTNASYIYAALAGEKTSLNTRVLLNVLNGIGSACGQLAMSGLEVWIHKRPVEKRPPITIALFIPSVSVIITVVLFLVLPKKALPLPYVLSAMGNGFLTAITVLVPRTLYAKDPAKHYNFLFLATAIAVIVLNRFLYGEWYTHAAKGVTECHKRVCVQVPLIVCVCISTTAFITNLILHFRYAAFCRAVLKERAVLRGEIEASEKHSSTVVEEEEVKKA